MNHVALYRHKPTNRIGEQIGGSSVCDEIGKHRGGVVLRFADGTIEGRPKYIPWKEVELIILIQEGTKWVDWAEFEARGWEF